MSERVIINDVGPRDGLQNQPKILSVVERLELIRALQAANVEHIEFGAFVSPKAVPAMAGSDDIIKMMQGERGELSALIPNRRGYDLAVEAGTKTVAMVAYGSEGMAQKNVRMSRAEADNATLQIIEQAKRDRVKVIATIATAFECPFDGPTDAGVVAETTAKFLEAGVSSVVIADTIGAANPGQVKSLMTRLVSDNGARQLACHFHDTRALGMANVFAGLETGIRRFDASISGLGGCPFAPGATGNIATEDTVMMLHQMGFETGIDLDKLIRASDLAEQLTGTAPGGRSKPWLKPFLERQNEKQNART